MFLELCVVSSLFSYTSKDELDRYLNVIRCHMLDLLMLWMPRDVLISY